MSKPARDAFLRFALGPDGAWRANFRDFGAAIRRMTTLCEGGRISEADVEAEVARLRAAWRTPDGEAAVPGATLLDAVLGPDRAATLDRFDRVQLADVVAVCVAQPSLSAAGRILFARSRQEKTSRNDADRLRKYLHRFGLTFDAIRAHAG